jgi:hypothetical protein
MLDASVSSRSCSCSHGSALGAAEVLFSPIHLAGSSAECHTQAVGLSCKVLLQEAGTSCKNMSVDLPLCLVPASAGACQPAGACAGGAPC